MSESLRPDQPRGPSLGDLALNELAVQFAQLARELAVLRAQYQQLMGFVESKAEVLGLTKVDGAPAEAQVNGSPVGSAEAQVNGSPVGSAVVSGESNTRE